jgi:hypothetical protein
MPEQVLNFIVLIIDMAKYKVSEVICPVRLIGFHDSDLA